MARSAYVYIVEDGELGDSLHAAFTVKHECVSWMRRQEPDFQEGSKVTRLPDGGHGERVRLGSGTEFLEREKGNRDAR